MTDPGCGAVRSQLPLFVGGDIDVATDRVVRAHLRDCPACRRDAGELLRARRRLAGVSTCTVLPGVDEDLFLRMHEHVLAEVAGLGDPRVVAPAHRLRWPVAAAAAALFLLGWQVGRPERGLMARSPIQADGIAASVAGGDGFGAPVLQALGHGETWPRGMPPAGGSGLMGRLSLRTLEDEQSVSIDDLFAVEPVPGRGRDR